MAGKTKTCKRCGADKPLAEFTKVTRNADGLNIWCKPCVKAREDEKRAAKEFHETVKTAKVQKIPPAKKTLTREQKDAANARAKAKRDEASEMRAAALEARS